MKNLLSEFVGLVLFTELVLNFEERTFGCQVHLDGNYVGFKEGRMSFSVVNYFTKRLKRYQLDKNGKFPIGSNGKRIYNFIGLETGFEKYCRLQGIPLNPQNFVEQLKTVQFSSVNKSKGFWENPFKVTMSNGVNSLKLVYEYPRQAVVTFDPVTNVETTDWYSPSYTDNGGVVRNKKFLPHQYVRCIEYVKQEVSA